MSEERKIILNLLAEGKITAREAEQLMEALDESDPYDLGVLDELRLHTGCPIELVLADEDSLANFIRRHYGWLSAAASNTRMVTQLMFWPTLVR